MPSAGQDCSAMLKAEGMNMNTGLIKFLLVIILLVAAAVYYHYQGAHTEYSETLFGQSITTPESFGIHFKHGLRDIT